MADFNGTAGDDLLKGTGGDDVMLGRLGDDTLQGLAGNDFLSGGGGDDVLNGGSGNDTLNGGAGQDQLLGGSGDDLIVVSVGKSPVSDVIDGGSGFDTLSFAGFQQQVTLILSDADSPITGVEAVIGTSFDDEIYGQRVSRGALDGADGNDILIGGHERDTLTGGAGDDHLQTDFQRAMESGGEGADTLFTSNGISTLDGGAGDDLLRAEGRHNELTGGDGADVFQFDNATRNGNLIQDLTGQDVIDISHIDAVKHQGGDQAFVLVASLGGHAGEAALVYDTGSDQTRLELDTDGDAVADKTILISGDHTGFTNFVL